VKGLAFEDWVAYEDLPARLADCDVALGIFGTTSKARMVIPRRSTRRRRRAAPSVSADTPALREVFTPARTS
jgi:hypothetical protein